MNSKSANVRNGRVKLLMVLGCFIGPLLVAFIWYYGLGGIGATSSLVNHAPLIEPVKTMTDFEQKDVQGQSLNLESLKRRWTIIHVLADGCPEDCQKALYNSRQMRAALGKDALRVQRFILSPNEALLTQIGVEHSDAIRALTIDPALGQQLQSIFSENVKSGYDAVLVDPLANAMMVIPVELNPSLLLKDMKKLLRLSKIG